MRSLFKVKVCGVTRSTDLSLLEQACVDAVGINLVPTSPRYVEPVRAESLARQARALGLQTVAVMMNPTAVEVAGLWASCVFDWLQLHGQESPALTNDLPQRCVIKALSWSGRSEELQLAEQWRSCPQLAAFLVDAYAPDVGGGSGRTARWDLLVPRPAVFADHPLILAGGLTADNVVQAVITTSCTGVDTASGVEQSPGVKDRDKLERFASEAWQALR